MLQSLYKTEIFKCDTYPMSTQSESVQMSTTQAENLTELTILSQQERSSMSTQEESVIELTMSTPEESVVELTMSTQEESVVELTMSTQDLELTMSTQEESVSPNQQTPRRSWRVQYRLRWFYSKGSYLVLIWILLANIANRILFNLLYYFIVTKYSHLFYLTWLPFVARLVSALLSGWLADALLGHYRTVKAGAVILYLPLILCCVLQLTLHSVIDNNHVLVVIPLLISSCLGSAGSMFILVTSLQLGLDQMPEASTANITSFIAWFVLLVFTGFWLGDASTTLLPCINQLDFFTGYFEILSLFPVLCASIILCSDFLLAPKWLKKEPKSQQSLKGIFKVLRYAKKHKYPVRRSALTFWEEELPSRLDLGKSKYGGPFTIEQVENVKTVLRMLVVSIPMWIIFTSIYVLQYSPTSFDSTLTNGTTATNSKDCSTAVVKLFTRNANWWVIIGIVINEFTIYPFIRKSLTILKRFGAASLALILVNSVYLILNIVSLNYAIEDPMGWYDIVRSVMGGLLAMVLLTSALEFVCAQSPLNMRSLLIGYIWYIGYVSYTISYILVGLFDTLYTSSNCTVIYYSLATVLSIVGFVLHCFLAHWYKRRKRDDTITTQQWVEEAYDRYLDADDRRHFRR